MGKVKFGIVGCGHIARAHAEEIIALPRAELAAACDIDPQALQTFAGRYGVKCYRDYMKMLERKELDVVIICTPSGLHAEMGVAAARAGKHVLVEKPLALTLEDADRLIETCEKEGVLLSVVLQNRYKPSFQMLKSAAEKGRFGKLSHAVLAVRWNRNDDYFNKSPWRGKKAEDGGVMMNQAIHGIDLLQWIMGKVDSVFAYTATRYRPIEAEDVGVAALKFKNGALGVIEAASTVYPSNLEESIAVFGEKGTVVIGGIKGGIIKTWHFSDDNKEDQLIHSWNGMDHNKSQGHRPVLIDMLEAIEKGCRPIIDGGEGRKSLEIVLGIYRSRELGLPVSLTLY